MEDADNVRGKPYVANDTRLDIGDARRRRCLFDTLALMRSAPMRDALNRERLNEGPLNEERSSEVRLEWGTPYRGAA